MNIVVVNTGDAGGGAERVAADVQSCAIAAGHDCAFITAGGNATRTGSVPLGGRLDWLLGRSIKRIGFADAFSVGAQRFLHHPLVKAADIVHFHNLHGSYFGMLSVPRIAKQKRVVWTLHDFWALTGGCYHHMGCDKWKASCGHCPQHGVYPMVGLFDTSASMHRIKRRAVEAVLSEGYIVAPSQWIANGVRESMPGHDERVVVINNAVDIHQFVPGPRAEARKSLGIKEDAFCVLMVAASLNNRMKGIAQGIEAINIAAASCRLTVLLVGHSDGELRKRIAANVIELGQINSPARMAEIYAAADLFVLPSVAENFPMTVLEAMACGAPTVAFDVGGVSEQVAQGVTGIIVAQRDAAAMAGAIVDLSLGPILLREMCAQARPRAEQLYSMEMFARRHLDLYAKAAGVRTPQPSVCLV